MAQNLRMILVGKLERWKIVLGLRLELAGNQKPEDFRKKMSRFCEQGTNCAVCCQKFCTLWQTLTKRITQQKTQRKESEPTNE
jgi:hypothetical protein